MNIKIILIFTLLVLLMPLSQISAQTKQELIEQKKQELRQQKQELNVNTQKQVEVKSVQIQEKKSEKINSFAVKHAERLEARFINIYYQRLSNIIDKTQERIEVLRKEGKDVGPSQEKLNQAKLELESAKNLAQASIDQFKMVSDQDQKELSAQAINTARQTKKSFANVLQLIKEAIQLAKNL